MIVCECLPPLCTWLCQAFSRAHQHKLTYVISHNAMVWKICLTWCLPVHLVQQAGHVCGSAQVHLNHCIIQDQQWAQPGWLKRELKKLRG